MLKLQFNRYKLLLFLRFIICQIFLFGVLLFICSTYIVDVFVSTNRISVHWSWDLFLGVLETFMCDEFKPDILICYLHRFVEGHIKGAGCVFRLVHINWLHCLIWNISWVLCSRLIFLIFDSCVFSLLYHC